MKAFLNKLPVRIIVYCLAVFSIISTVASFIGLIIGSEVNEEQVKANLYCRAGEAYSTDILSHIAYENGVPTYNPIDYPFMDYTIVYSNKLFGVETVAQNTEVLFSTKNMNLTNLPYCSTYKIENGKYMSCGVVFGSDSAQYDYNLKNLCSSHSEITTQSNIYVMIYFEIDSGVDPTGYMLMEQANKFAHAIGILISASIPAFIISFLVLIISLTSLIVGTDDRITFWERIPLFIHFCLVVSIEGAMAGLGVTIINEFAGFNRMIIPAVIVLVVFVATAMITILLWTIINYTRRIKAHKLYQTTLIYSLGRFVKRALGFLTNNLSITLKAVIGIIILSLIQLLIIVTINGAGEIGLFLAIIYKIVAIALVIKFLSDWKKIKEGSKRYASGDLSCDIDTTKMIPELKKHANNINSIGDGIQAAVTDRMKSERMKTELITNVSHDIKTPLTSIINYVDLLSKHGGESADETTKEYLEVLERQSSRLKKLIEDLIEASKASSGNIEMTIEKVNASMVVNQAIAEFSDKLQKSNLSLITNLDEYPDAYIEADGRYLWRVVDNLLNNICKYSMSGTRVYVDIAEADNTTTISFKNMSATPLNLSAEELTERFVRGDSSRNTEGSGLGLSIAGSLTELMGGKLDIAIDGDLFKAILTFNKT